MPPAGRFSLAGAAANSPIIRPIGPARTGTVAPSRISPERMSSAERVLDVLLITRYRGRAP
jgi:hypothetical protein